MRRGRQHAASPLVEEEPLWRELAERSPLVEEGALAGSGGEAREVRAGEEARPRSLAERWRLARRRLAGFRVSPWGILLLARWLPLQDIGSDLNVTFGGGGLCWDMLNPWWGRLSVTFIVVPYVLLWILAGPVVVRAGLARLGQNGKGVVPRYAACALWLLFGPFFVAIFDVLMLVLFPREHPRSAWILNVSRVRVFLETTIESPCQTLLQVRILWVKLVNLREDVGWFHVRLVFSVCTSMLSFGLAALEVYETSREQGISFLTCLIDMLDPTPLLHVIKLHPKVGYEDEGPLTVDHCRQIARAARASAVLERIEFTKDNELSALGIVALLETFSEPARGTPSITVGERGYFDERSVCLDFGGDDSLEDEFLEELAQHLPKAAQSVKLSFDRDRQFTDRGLEQLARHLPGTVQSVQLSFLRNQNFTDRGLERLARSLPNAAQSVHLGFGCNQNFTDRGLEKLAQHLPSAAQDVHLNFSRNREFTDQGLARLAQHLPRAAQRVQLVFHWNENFTKRAIQRLQGKLPPGSYCWAAGRGYHSLRPESLYGELGY